MISAPMWKCWVSGSVWFASEMKALKDECERFEIFPPGHIYSSKQGMVVSWSLSPQYPLLQHEVVSCHNLHHNASIGRNCPMLSLEYQ